LLGEHIIGCCGELHLEICLHDLQTMYLENIPIKISSPTVMYCETIITPSKSTVCSKSPNKLNRLYMNSVPLNEQLCCAFDNGDIKIGANKDKQAAKGKQK
jgi:translation elongation factor EF-G